MCGAVATGNYYQVQNSFDPNDRNVMLGMSDAIKGPATMIFTGQFSECFAQTINKQFDRDINAIIEPYCPHFGVITMTLGLDHWTGHNSYTVTATALLGYVPSYIDSSPPLNLKQNIWLGDLTIGICYISFPW